MTNHPHKHNPSMLSFIYKWLFDPEFKHGFHHVVERSIGLLIIASV